MIYESMFTGALVGHLVGDFVLQDDRQAAGKKKSHALCFLHVMIYTTAIMIFSAWWRLDGWLIGPVYWAIFIPHYLIDRWQFVPWLMRTMGQKKFMEPPMSPWSRIAVDNTLHLVCLWVLWQYIRTTGGG